MLKAADALAAERQKQAENLCRDIRDALADLSFMEVRFDMVFDRLPECTANGIDDCYFVISTNVGEKMRPLYGVASGGEALKDHAGDQILHGVRGQYRHSCIR